MDGSYCCLAFGLGAAADVDCCAVLGEGERGLVADSGVASCYEIDFSRQIWEARGVERGGGVAACHYGNAVLVEVQKGYK